MFDSLKKKLKDFETKARDEVELEDVQPMSDDELEAELAALEAEVNAELEEEHVEPEAPAAPTPPEPEPVRAPEPEPEPAKAEFEVVRKERAPEPEPKPEAPRPKPEAPTPPPPMPERKPEPAAEPEAPAPKPEPRPEPKPQAPKPEPKPAPEPKPVAPTPEPKPVAQRAAPLPMEGGKAINTEKLEDLFWDLELTLLESDVAMEVVEQIKDKLKQNLARVRVKSSEDVPGAVEAALRHSMLQVLAQERIDFDAWIFEKLMDKKPVVLMFVGVNGTGKTTTIGRIAHRLKENGLTSVMAAGDTFRAGAIEQLSQHADRVGVTIIKTKSGGDPAAVAYDAIEHAKGRRKDVVLLDTAGRMQTNTNLMDEMKKIKRVAEPDMIIFVGDSLAGNDAVEQAKKFNEAVGIDSCILTKVDTDAKGGAALSIAQAVGKPILFLGVGQEYTDLVAYDPRWMVNRIFEEGELAEA